MKIFFSILTLSFLLFTGCTSDSESTISGELIGKWKLSKEVVNKKTLSYSENPIKTILSIEEEGYFHMYDDVSDSGLGDEIGNIQSHYKGQYVFEKTSLQLKHEEDGVETTEEFAVEKISETELILLDKEHKKELHYSKL